MRLKKLGILFGGRSAEHEVSVQSAASIWQAADRNKYDLVPIAITKGGKWIVGLDPLKVQSKGGVVPELTKVQDPASALGPVDVVFPVLHGPFGEDGTIQGLLEILGKPYVGAGVLASSLAMDKAMAKVVFAYHNFPQGRYLVFHRDYCRRNLDSVTQAIMKDFGFPCFIKPANMGSSVGISKVHTADKLWSAFKFAAQYDRKILIEEYIDGREIEVSVLGNESPIASVPGEILPSAEFYDYNAKYIDASEVRIPAPLTPAQVKAAQSLAVGAYKAVDCSGLARVDFFLRKSDGKFLINEINTMPGFTRISAYPKLWEASGLAYDLLIDRLVALALDRYASSH